MNKPSFVILIPGIFFFFLAFFTVCAMPFMQKESKLPQVINIEGKTVTVDNPYNKDKNIAWGRQIYIREVCWQCHSQYVRPVSNEGVAAKNFDISLQGKSQYYIVSQPGESAYDKPHLYGTRRIGPDLAREGNKWPIGWNIAHLQDPQSWNKNSVMPKFSWLSWDELKAVANYLDSLGKSIGDFRGEFSLETQKALNNPLVDDTALRKLGQSLFPTYCAPCHNYNGDGMGPYANTINALNEKVPVANFTDNIWKYAPNADVKLIFNLISVGMPVTNMPMWQDKLSMEERWALAYYVRSFSKKK